MNVFDLIPAETLDAAMGNGYVRRQLHPYLPLGILNYTEKAAYDVAWDAATLNCRGLIYERAEPFKIVARPFPKFFNHGQPGAPDLDLDAPVAVTDKLDGSLGILYPCSRCETKGILWNSAAYGPHQCPVCHGGCYLVATRGSFISEQAIHATDVWRSRYASTAFAPRPGMTYLFEIIYPGNRVVCDYGDLDDLVFLAAVENSSGRISWRTPWPGMRVEEHPYYSLADALRAEPRKGAEGFVVYFPDANELMKIKQDDYVALHRILTGTNARHVWEVAAVQACWLLIREPRHWGTYLGIDPARAAQVNELGDDWLAEVPDEFYTWVQDVIGTATDKVKEAVGEAHTIAETARQIADRRARYEFVVEHMPRFEKEIMRFTFAVDNDALLETGSAILLRAWREACPEPTAPFNRGEDVA